MYALRDQRVVKDQEDLKARTGLHFFSQQSTKFYFIIF